MPHKAGKLGRGMVIEAIVVAAVIAVPMVSFTWHVLPVSDANLFQKFLFYLNLPAVVFWAGSGGENDSSRTVLRYLILVQWVFIGGAIGFLLAILRRAIKAQGRKVA